VLNPEVRVIDRLRISDFTGESSNKEKKRKNRRLTTAPASRAGTRSVTTLNAEQLARKRANDREAQRAIRQRTREHIERLENRIKELSENNPESDAAFEAVQRRNAELEDELRQLRKTLYGMGEGSHSPAASQQRKYSYGLRTPRIKAHDMNPLFKIFTPVLGNNCELADNPSRWLFVRF